MYSENDALEPPDNPDIPIWRYMDFMKYVWFLDKQALFFACADRMDDPFEGATTRANVEQRPQVYGRYAERAESFYRALPRFVFLNCWHMNEVESAAMWKLYGEGVAIRSTFRRLTDALAEYAPPVYVGVVNYIDYGRDRISGVNVFRPYVHKRKSFEHERELRALCHTVPEPEAGGEVDMTQGSPSGLVVPVQLSTLVESVYVAPGAPEWLRELTASVTKRYGLEVAVRQSSLDGDPLY